MVRFLTDSQLKHISKHEYCVDTSGGTFLENLFLGAYWKWLLGKVPEWLAPNVLSISALVINVFVTVLMCWYCPTATEEAPALMYFLYALGMFLRQSLDGIDGSHARKTGNDTPLGELMDHGSDAVSMVFLALGTSMMAQLGKEPVGMFYAVFASLCSFYIAHWRTYVTGTLKMGKFDAPEMEMMVILLFLTTGVFGPSIWNIQVPIFGVTMRRLFVFGITVATINTACSYLCVFSCYKTGKKQSTVAGTSVASPGAPVLVVIYTAYHVARFSNAQLFQSYSCLFLFTHGLVLAKITIKLLVATISKSPTELADLSMTGGILQVLNCQFGSRVNEHTLLCLTAIHVVCDLLFYCAAVGSEICQYLDIKWFAINQNPSSCMFASNAVADATHTVD